MLADKIRKRVDLPHEDGEWVEIRMLSWKQLEAARSARMQSVLAEAKDLDVGVLKELRAEIESEDIKSAVASNGTDRLASQFDTQSLLVNGITGWSYEEAVSEEAVADLDGETAGFLARAIANLSARTSRSGEASSVGQPTSS